MMHTKVLKIFKILLIEQKVYFFQVEARAVWAGVEPPVLGAPEQEPSYVTAPQPWVKHQQNELTFFIF